MSCDPRIYDKNIAEMNSRIDSAMIDIRKRLDENPEAPIYDLIKMLINYESSKRTMVWEKEKLCRNACDRFEGRRKDALA